MAWHFNAIAISLVFGLSLFVYYSSLSYGWLEAEDGAYFLRNPLLGDAPLSTRLAKAWTLTWESNWIPGTWTFTIFWESLFGLSAPAFRSVALLLHCANALLLFFLGKRLEIPRVASLCGVLVFLVHPVVVESVVWISSLKGLLSVFFALGALLTLSFLADKKARVLHWLAIGLFAVAILCKQDVVTLPLLVLLLFPRTAQPLNVHLLIPFTALSSVGIIAALFANQRNVNPVTPDTLGEQLSRPFCALGHYLSNWFWPSELYPEYAAAAAFSPVTTPLGIGALLVVLLLVGCHLFAKSRSVSLEFRLFSCAVFALVPFLGWFPNPLEFASDRVSYFATAFMGLCFAGLVAKVFSDRLKGFVIMMGGVILLFVSLSQKQAQIWQNDRVLWSAVRERAPSHYLATINLALVHAREKNWERARPLLERVTTEHPERVLGWIHYAQVLHASHRIEEMKQATQHGLERHPQDPQLIQLHEVALSN